MPSVVRKAELTGMVAKRLGCSEFEAFSVLNAVLKSIQEAMEQDDRVVLTGFGTFEARKTAARSIRLIGGRNAGKLVRLPASRRVKFTAGSDLKKIALDQQK